MDGSGGSITRKASHRRKRPADPTREPAQWPVIGATQTLTQRVYEVVRDRIIEGDLVPRSRVREEQLGAAMGVSRTPVREALSRLASEGFLERLPHRGFRVPERSVEELVHLYTVLRALELLACELAFPRITPADLDDLARANAGFARAVEANDVATAVDLNNRFHHLLAERSGNPVLSRLLDDLRVQVRRLEVLDFTAVLLESGQGAEPQVTRDTWVAQHGAFIAALRAGERARALEIMRENRSFVFRAKASWARATERREAENSEFGGRSA